jgi:dCMP deaminase
MAKRYTQEILDKVKYLYCQGIVQFDIAQQLGLTKHQVKRIIQQVLSKEKILEIVKTRKRFENSFYVGQKHGRLTIKKYLYKQKIGVCFECLCDCGKVVVLPKHYVITENTQSCGCLYSERLTCFAEISGKYWLRVQQNAMTRNIDFDLDIKDAWDIFVQQNKICAISGIPLSFAKNYNNYKAQNASLDRIDCKIGYVKNNVRWVHKDLNKMRGTFSDEVFLEYCRQCFLHQYTVGKIKKPTFDEYFLMLAFDVSSRSDDPNIRHGAVIVTHQNHIIGSGYNATIRGANESKIPYELRDKKRLWMIHAEENAILNCTVNPLTLVNGAKIYVTGLPCVNCLQRVINFGITEIYHAKRIGSIKENDDTEKMRKDILEMSKIKVCEIELNSLWLRKNLI